MISWVLMMEYVVGKKVIDIGFFGWFDFDGVDFVDVLIGLFIE